MSTDSRGNNSTSVAGDAVAKANDFERNHARHLRAMAYRMLGSRADAQDVVQDAWLRWNSVDAALVTNVRAFLSRTVTNLCLDRLNSAGVRREHYVGMWLPEPLVDDVIEWSPDPQESSEFAQDVSLAFMLTLERLSPLERAAFLLHDIFDLDYDEVALHLQRSATTCRQLASRARTRVRGEYARCQVSDEERQRLIGAFATALVSGDVVALTTVLATDAVLITDGGGLANALPKPLCGGALIAKALVGFNKTINLAALRYRTVTINGLPGYVIYQGDGTPLQAIALGPAGDDRPGLLQAIYIIRNPDKLRHLALSDQPAPPIPVTRPRV